MEIGIFSDQEEIKRSSQRAALFHLQFFLDKQKENVYNFKYKVFLKENKGENKGSSYGYYESSSFGMQQKTFVSADFTRQLHDYQFSEEEVNQFIDAYEKENAKRAKLTYKVKQYLPDKVVISLNPETVSMEKTILNHMQTFYQEHRKDYPGIIEANQAQNKAYREEMMASLADRPLTTPDRYDYQLTFVKKDGKWEVEKAYPYLPIRSF